MTLSSGAVVLNGGATLGGATMTQSGGTVTVNGAVSSTAAWTQSGRETPSVASGATLTVSGTSSFGGTLTGSGTAIFAGGTRLQRPN